MHHQVEQERKKGLPLVNVLLPITRSGTQSSKKITQTREAIFSAATASSSMGMVVVDKEGTGCAKWGVKIIIKKYQQINSNVFSLAFRGNGSVCESEKGGGGRGYLFAFPFKRFISYMAKLG